MPVCSGGTSNVGCNQACNCSVEEDGFFALRPNDGRRNTVVSGGGFDADNPYVLEFQLSEFYLPPSMELRIPLKVAPNDVEVPLTLASEHSFVYESPSVGVLEDPPESLSDGSADPTLGVLEGEFHMIGASAKFPPAASGTFSLAIASLNPVAFALSGVALETIAGQKLNATAAASQYLTCYGFAPSRFVFGNISPVLIGPTRLDVVYVELWQTTGASINVTDLKVWVTTI